jgi:hypothetical protein
MFVSMGCWHSVRWHSTHDPMHMLASASVQDNIHTSVAVAVRLCNNLFPHVRVSQQAHSKINMLRMQCEPGRFRTSQCASYRYLHHPSPATLRIWQEYQQCVSQTHKRESLVGWPRGMNTNLSLVSGVGCSRCNNICFSSERSRPLEFGVGQ